ncbi:PKD domain-containing protein [Flaviaesturariibacter amylovorans]|uniref:PKD domain-containing protein n=1 Tax=Flaviaesturariibacter amylovorans TaxID=1084520 RepID=A0ABP8GNH2_9BACT
MLLLLAGTAGAQQVKTGRTTALTAELTASTRSGCAPLVVRFTDASTGSPTQWSWDLGNGTVSTQQHPSTTYFNPGTYTVRLRIRNASGADSVTKTAYITVVGLPVAALSASDSAGCAPFTTTFRDESTSDSSIITRTWDFGDGHTSTTVNPAHTYANAGTYTVSLKVTNSAGCSRTVSKPQLIRVSPRPEAAFTYSNPASCAAPHAVHFTNGTPGNGHSYLWSFGDGSTSTERNPVHSYNSTGSFSVSLIVTSANGCRDTVLKAGLVNVGFSSQFTAPASACVNTPLAFINNTAPAASTQLWSFGDGSTSTDVSPVKVFTAPGIYTVKLVNVFSGCADSSTQVVTVLPRPVAAFSAPVTASCLQPFTASFANTSAGAVAYAWEFGDGTTSTLAAPQHTYTAPGAYDVRLIVTNAEGCSDTLLRTGYIKISKPVISIAGLGLANCLPLSVAPVATIESPDPVVSYLWNFGDGTTSTSASPAHTYTVAGVYDVTLTVATASGCTETLRLPAAVRADHKPTAGFTFNPADVCAMQAVQFTNTSTGTNANTTYFWTFGDGDGGTQQHPLHEYQNIGWMSVQLVVANGGCRDTVRQERIIFVRPPIARFVIDNHCDDRLTKSFRDRSAVAETWAWDFGDGTTSTQRNPVHRFPGPGSYVVVLRVTNGACYHTRVKTVVVIDEKARFTANTSSLCKGAEYAVTAQGINAANIASWSWDFGDGHVDATPGAARHVYARAGNYTVTLTIRDLYDCPSTYSLPVEVRGPEVIFSQSLERSCFTVGGVPVAFADGSIPDGVNPLEQWTWNFGDGTIDSSGALPITHVFRDSGAYSVSLRVRDAGGCYGYYTRPAAVRLSAPPVVAFHSPDTLTCTDRPVAFRSTSAGSGALSMRWSFGDGHTSVLPAPTHRYAHTGTYTVKLQVTDAQGCTDSLVRPQYIRISRPVARFALSDSAASCPPLQVQFRNNSTDILSQVWDFGNGNTSTLAEPAHLYTEAGTFRPRLVVTGPGGCTDTLLRTVTVKGPSGTISYSPLSGCAPLTVNLVARTRNRDSLIWDFGDGHLKAGRDSILQHVFADSGRFTPRLILIDATGCTVPVTGPDTVRTYEILPAVAADRLRFCDSGFVQFRGLSVSNDILTGWQWDFGDGSSSTERHPRHQYRSPGTYRVVLRNTSLRGCSAEDRTLLITVLASPVATLRVPVDAACVPATFGFSGGTQSAPPGTLSWHWNFGNGRTDTVQAPGPQQYPLAGTYTVTLRVQHGNGCGDTVTRSVLVRALPLVDAGSTRLLCRDSSLRLQASGASTYSWIPDASLSCTDCSTPLARPRVDATFFVTGTDAFGCKGSDSVRIRVQQPFRMLRPPVADTLCVGERVQLAAGGADRYRWSPATGLDNPQAAAPTAAPSATTTYKVIATDSVGCFRDSAEVAIRVYPIPQVYIGADRSVKAGDTVVLRAQGSPDISSWKWSPAGQLSCTTCPAPVVTAMQTTHYRLQVRNDGGCRSQDEVNVTVLCDGGNLFFPNTFSPNADGMNDRFYPRGTGITGIRSLRIFNRWGELVYERAEFKANDPLFGWDGTYKGRRAASDVYIYTCEVICSNSQVLPVKGDLTLLQ